MKGITGITLSNKHRLTYVVASGALAFDGRGWFWERWLVALGFIRPELFTVFLKTLTLAPRLGNLKWWCAEHSPRRFWLHCARMRLMRFLLDLKVLAFLRISLATMLDVCTISLDPVAG